MVKQLTPQEEEEFKQFKALQAGYPGVQPPKGWVPPIDTVLRPMGVYDTKSGAWVGLPLQALIEALVQAEYLTPLGKIDSRNAITLTVPSGTGVGLYATRKNIEVPAGEVWFITALDLVTPVQHAGIVLANVRISNWPDSAATPDADGLPFWATNQGGAGGLNVTGECYQAAPLLIPLGEAIGTPIKLPPGAKLTICAEVTTAQLNADSVITLTPYGWKGKLLAPVS
jgi:hypothetical protein